MDQEPRFLNVDGVRLGYKLNRIAAAKHNLIMLNGLASNLSRWSEFVNGTALQTHWNLLRPDRRGHGLSMYRGRISRPRWIKDLDAILEHEKLLPAVLMGHSLGAEVALDYALRYPAKVEALILIDPVFPENLSGRLGRWRRIRGILWLPILLLWFFNSLGLRRRHFPARDLHELDRRTRSRLAADPQLRIADLYTNPLADLPYLPLANYLQDLYEAGRPLASLKGIHQPVLVLLSSGSSLAYRARNEARIAELSNVDCQWIDCDHWPLTERPDEVRHMIDNWCRIQFPDSSGESLVAQEPGSEMLQGE